MDKVEMWTRHFQRMAEGKLKPDHKGNYVVEKIQTGGVSKEPTIQFVTPVAQAVELAKSELKKVYKGKDVTKKRYPKTSKTNTKGSRKTIRKPSKTLVKDYLS